MLLKFIDFSLYHSLMYFYCNISAASNPAMIFNLCLFASECWNVCGGDFICLVLQPIHYVWEFFSPMQGCDAQLALDELKNESLKQKMEIYGGKIDFPQLTTLWTWYLTLFQPNQALLARESSPTKNFCTPQMKMINSYITIMWMEAKANKRYSQKNHKIVNAPVSSFFDRDERRINNFFPSHQRDVIMAEIYLICECKKCNKFKTFFTRAQLQRFSPFVSSSVLGLCAVLISNLIVKHFFRPPPLSSTSDLQKTFPTRSNSNNSFMARSHNFSVIKIEQSSSSSAYTLCRCSSLENRSLEIFQSKLLLILLVYCMWLHRIDVEL